MLAAALASVAIVSSDTLVFVGKSGPGLGKHIVLLAGDEEYRSEEMLPQLARILAERHGFKCTVVFSLNAKGEIDPNEQSRQPGIEALQTADVCVMMLRFREWEDREMKFFGDYFASGKPIFALRTSTHAFDYPEDSTSQYRTYSWKSRTWKGGFGKQILGETWVSHWGNHGTQATRGIVVADHPVTRGVRDVFVSTDVYEAAPPADAQVLMRGEVVEGMKAGDPAAKGRKKSAAGVEQELNDPMMPVVWVRDLPATVGNQVRVLTSTMGSATDFSNEGFRRMTVNGVFWLTGVAVPDKLNVDLIGEYRPSPFGFEGFRKGVKPRDFAIGSR